MASRLLLESGVSDGILIEDGLGVLLLELDDTPPPPPGTGTNLPWAIRSPRIDVAQLTPFSPLTG